MGKRRERTEPEPQDGDWGGEGDFIGNPLPGK